MKDRNLGPALMVVAWLFAAVAIAVVCARYWVRFKIVRKMHVDDYLILVTLFLALGNSAFCSISVHWGLGRHVEFLSPLQIMHSIKWVYLCEIFSILSPGFGRISYAILLLTIIPPNQWRRRFLWTIIACQFVVDVGTVIISMVQCRPIEGFWDRSIDANCWPPTVQEYTGYFQGSVCSLVDLILAAFPASLFWNLNMKTSMKLSLSILMGLGMFAMVTSIAKTVQLRAISQTNDLTYAMSELAICWTLEAYIVLIAASLPTLKPLMYKRTDSRYAPNAYSAGSGNPSRGQSKMNTWLGRASKSRISGDEIRDANGSDAELFRLEDMERACVKEAPKDGYIVEAAAGDPRYSSTEGVAVETRMEVAFEKAAK